MDDDDRAYWRLMRGPAVSDHALRAWEEAYLAQCKLPKAEQELVDDYLHKRYPWKYPEAAAAAEAEEREFHAEQMARAEQKPEPYNAFPYDKPKDWSWRDKPKPRTGQKLCAGCALPLAADAPRNAKYHPECRSRLKMRRYRAKKAAQDKEVRQILGLEPIEEKGYTEE